MSEQIPVSAPALVGNEKEYVIDCIESTWISSKGKYVDEFERGFAEFCGTSHAVTCANGTTALHLVLEAFGIGSGDSVIVPDLTFVSTANAVRYCDAEPVFADVDPETWNIDPEHVAELADQDTAAILPVHLYGHPAPMDEITAIANEHDAVVIEDAAEAHGAQYKGETVGSLGDAAIFSFYGNKIITTGEGGMVVTDDPDVSARVRHLKDLAMDQSQRYYFEEIGYNYRMTNMQAAIGCAQLEDIDWHCERRRNIASLYNKHLPDLPEITAPVERSWADHAYWIYSIILDDSVDRRRIRDALDEAGIETRPFFPPMTSLPPYEAYQPETPNEIADSLSKGGINLPTWAKLDEGDVKRVCEELETAIRQGR